MAYKLPRVLAFDTSNYTTSVALVDRDENIVLDRRVILSVKQGKRGLRQSHALFQHNQNLPGMLEDFFAEEASKSVEAIAVSDKPRPIPGSYMPVFTAGLSAGRIIASALNIPLLKFSHQEGHLAAGALGSGIKTEEPFLAFQLSGGTTELLYVKEGSIKKIGGSLDISFGQLIDRVGVIIGLNFPAGPQMDRHAGGKGKVENQKLQAVHFKGMDINLSGLETQVLRWIEKESPDLEAVSSRLFEAIANALIIWTEKAVKAAECEQILFTGGVAASETIRRNIEAHFKDLPARTAFGLPSLSSDNAVGTGLLGVRKIWP
ncbi:O-sialoglycoprotein endopeptidase [Bacillota bacterium]